MEKMIYNILTSKKDFPVQTTNFMVSEVGKKMSLTFSKPPEPLELADRTTRGANWKKLLHQWNIFEVPQELTRSASEFEL